jgi:hypothetical protein
MKRFLAAAIVSGLILLILVTFVLTASQNRRAARMDTGVSPASAPSQVGLAFTNHHSSYDGSRYSMAEKLVPAGGTVTEVQGGEAIDGENSKTSSLERKIIYSAKVELVVEDFHGMADKVAALVKRFDAYVAGSNLAGTTGETRRGSWKVRVPTARFDEFIAAAKGLGELQSAGTTSKDVSEEYYDVDARIRNKTKEEERLLKLLEERPGKLEDVIAIERELSRVRGELEHMQGRMRVLADLTALTTVELAITEVHDYKPLEAATLATRLRRTFEDSLETLGATGANLLVVLAAIVPWLPLVALAVGAGYAIWRTQRPATRSAA